MFHLQEGDWGDVEEYAHSSRGCNGFVGNWEYDDNVSKLEALGLKAVIDDVRFNYNQFLEGISAQSNVSARFLLDQKVN